LYFSRRFGVRLNAWTVLHGKGRTATVSFPCIPFFPSATFAPCARPLLFVFAPAHQGSLRNSTLRDNAEMAPVDGEELQAVLAKDIATVVAIDPEGSESYRSRE
jgi:hypothetical protein